MRLYRVSLSILMERRGKERKDVASEQALFLVSILLKAVNIVLFQYFTQKICQACVAGVERIGDREEVSPPSPALFCACHAG